MGYPQVEQSITKTLTIELILLDPRTAARVGEHGLGHVMVRGHLVAEGARKVLGQVLSGCYGGSGRRIVTGQQMSGGLRGGGMGVSPDMWHGRLSTAAGALMMRQWHRCDGLLMQMRMLVEMRMMLLLMRLLLLLMLLVLVMLLRRLLLLLLMIRRMLCGGVAICCNCSCRHMLISNAGG